MTDYKQIYMDYMDETGIKYIDHDEYHVEVRYTGDNLNTIPVHVFFAKDGSDNVRLVCWKIYKCPKEELGAACGICNLLNKKFRWVKFYVDEDYDFVGEMDALIDPVFVGDECAKLVRKMVNIIDEAHPKIDALMWSV